MPTEVDTVDEHGRVLLPGISSRAFEHPSDRTALTALRSLPGFEQVVKVASGMLRERQYRLVYLASAVRVDARQYRDLDGLLGEAMAVLDVADRPECYVHAGADYRAVTLGVDQPFVTLSSGLYDALDQDELRFVLGHELGHVLSGHALYQSLLMHLLNLAGSFAWVPVGGLGLRALTAALREWQRKAELSADRAGLLVAQDPDVALRVQLKLAGGPHTDRIDVDAFLAQAAEYELAGDLRDGLLKLLNTERSDHPFAAVRAAEARRWVESGEYRAILAGDYPRREDDPQSLRSVAGEAAHSYKKRIDESVDPIVNAVRGVGATIGSLADTIGDWLGSRASSSPGAERPAPEARPDDAPPEEPPSQSPS